MPPPVIPHFLLVLLTIVFGLASKSTSTRITYFIIALSIYIPFFITPYPDGDKETLIHVGLVGSFLLAATFNFLVLQSPKDAPNPNKLKKPLSQLPLLHRLKWATNLLFNLRGVGWNNAAPGLRFPQQSRWRYVVSQLYRAGYYYALGDILGFFIRRNPAFVYPPTEGFGARGLVWQMVNVMIFWTAAVAMMSRFYASFSALSVSLGVFDPEDWPAYFGIWSKTKSVRTFWGRSWHQSLRRSIQPHSKYLTQNVLRFPPKSLPSTYIQLFTCFFLSGVYHAAGEWVAQRNPSSALINIKFFVLQAAIITLEDFLIFLGKNVGIDKVPSIASYAWVVGCMTLSCPAWMEAGIRGNSVVLVPEVSVVEMVCERVGLYATAYA